MGINHPTTDRLTCRLSSPLPDPVDAETADSRDSCIVDVVVFNLTKDLPQTAERAEGVQDQGDFVQQHHGETDPGQVQQHSWATGDNQEHYWACQLLQFG